MLSKEKRLNKESFNRLFSVGKKEHTPHLMFVHGEDEGFHASVVVSKKIYKTAVKRNKLRRQIYDILRRTQKNTGTTGIYILVAKPNITGSTLIELKNEITHILTKKS